MEQFNKLNEVFNTGPIKQWRWWVPLAYIIILGVAITFWMRVSEGVNYIITNGLKPSIIRLWEGPNPE